MKKEYSATYKVSAADGNAEGELSLVVLASNIIAVATAHANALGIGNAAMHGKAGWVLSRLTIEMTRYPEVEEEYNIITWVESWNKHFSERCFEITDGAGNTLGYSRSIWMMMNRTTHENAGLDTLEFSTQLISDRLCPIERQKRHRPMVNPVIRHYTFRYSDIDYYRHVNTLRYIQLLLNGYPLDTYEHNRVGRFEIAFMHESYFGEEAEIHTQQCDEHTSQILITTPRAMVIRARVRLDAR